MKKVVRKYPDRLESVLFPLLEQPRNIYIGCTLDHREEALRLAFKLTCLGLNITSRWLGVDLNNRPRENDWRRYIDYCTECSIRDFEDLREADTLILLAQAPSATGGYHVEFGYFLGLGKKNIVVISDRPNVFYWQEDVRYASSSKELISWLRDEMVRYDRLTSPA